MKYFRRTLTWNSKKNGINMHNKEENTTMKETIKYLQWRSDNQKNLVKLYAEENNELQDIFCWQSTANLSQMF